MTKISSTITLTYVPEPQDGAAGVNICVSPETVVFKRNGGTQRLNVYVDFYEGGELVAYGSGDNGLECSVLTAGGAGKITDNLGWNFFIEEETRFYYRLTYYGSGDVDMEIPFTVFYKGRQYQRRIIVRTVADGEPGAQGDRGPTLRGPQAWSDCATGYKFQSGAKGEAYKDMVLYQNNYYSCVKSHTRTASNYPGSSVDQTNKYWQLGDKVELIITKILLSTYALVENLGVETIDMKDAEGNILFQAKDGNVICKTGTFENIKVDQAEITNAVFSGVIIKKRTEITAANFQSVFRLQTDSDNQYDIDLKKCGTWLDIRYLPRDVIIYPCNLRALCSNTILLYNNTSHSLSISTPCTKDYDGGPGAFTSFTIDGGEYASLECKIGTKDGKEVAYFVSQRGAINKTLDN